MSLVDRARTWWNTPWQPKRKVRASAPGGNRIAAARDRYAEGAQPRTRFNTAKTNPLRNAETLDQAEGGYCNSFVDYLHQISEVYRMLEGYAAYGNEQTKSIISFRTAFLSGEGIRVSSESERLQKWIESWLSDQDMDGRTLLDAVQESEIVGHVLFTVDEGGMLTCHPSFVGHEGYDSTLYGYSGYTALSGDWQQPAWWPRFEGTRLVGIQRRGMGAIYEPWLTAGMSPMVYIRTGGHGNVARFPAPTSRMCLVIDSVKNYDRAVRQARQLNHESTRQSPSFELPSDEGAADEHELAEYYQGLQDSGWSMGDPIVTPGKVHMLSSDAGPVQTLSTEAGMIVKDLSATTGIPPHWLGYTDLMSNRATADSLFEAIDASTLVERRAWEKGITEAVKIARRMLGGPAGEFTINLPLLSFQQFAIRSEALLGLKGAGVIGAEDVRGQLPFDAQGPDAEDEAQMQAEQQAKNGPQGVVPREDAG